ncbi:S41 family peptidase [Streptomyces benahoarensis]|uniref:PDZ domain-containing protein n=1 Tax=Streptomyces benahoarensis TaxID=2595054 RepID=A0A553ZB61_9ACTN|nr:S41 family peptidase [Streptomyces benahoarensis]TSB22075.1 PDZ domain-containing protein [Streptomyces benahoarensis]TSB38675.1 PDZ domain-containing protein [Streptomyces benahoarensis]
MSRLCLSVRPRRIRRGAALTLTLATVLATGAAAGSWHAGHTAHPRPEPSAASGSLTADRAAVEKAAAEAMAAGKSGAEAAAEVVSRSGDRWSTIYTAGEFEDFQRQLDGDYVGVGLWLRQARGGRLEVSRVRPGGPAARAGTARGDRLVAVDGRPVRGRPVTEVVALLRGDGDDEAGRGRAGTPVELALQRGARTWSTTVHRARLRSQDVTTDRPAGASGPVRIRAEAFTKGSGAAIRDAVRAAPPDAGLLLDLRGNTGGLVAEATAAASAFLDGGLVATYDVHGRQRALYAGDGGNTRVPLVVLVDGGTMSAAELLAGALQDRGRAVVVGSPTFGKGSVQMPSTLPDGSVAELTVGHYRTPAGRTVDGHGITPDLTVEDGATARAVTVLSGLGTGA